jgi:hypothetical protein
VGQAQSLVDGDVFSGAVCDVVPDELAIALLAVLDAALMPKYAVVIAVTAVNALLMIATT